MEDRVPSAVFDHPDDEAFGTGRTLARHAAEGCQVHLVKAVRGEAGEIATGINTSAFGKADLREIIGHATRLEEQQAPHAIEGSPQARGLRRASHPGSFGGRLATVGRGCPAVVAAGRHSMA